MNARMTILCDNAVAPQIGLIGEHGFACLVETERSNYLFDTGQGLAILNNSRILGKDLGDVQAIVLSHGHFDHTGGLPDVLHRTGPIDVLAHPEVFRARYRTSPTHRRFIGLPFRREHLESLGARFRPVRDWTEIGPGVFATGEIPRPAPARMADPGLTAVQGDGREVPDSFDDDLSMVLDTPSGLVLLLGCAHAGLVNIMRHVRERTGRKRIHAVIGGTHLGFAGQAEFEEALQALEEAGVERIGASHCTGFEQAARLYAHFGERFFFATAGSVLEA